jgi:hypothetical protein
MTDARREQEPDVVRAAPTPEPLNLKPGIAAKEPGRTAPVASHVPFLRPSPPAAVTPTPPVTAMKQPKQDRDVEVRIGTIEIRATVPSPAPPLSEPAPVLGDPAEGLESYRSLRRYSSWFRG